MSCSLTFTRSSCIKKQLYGGNKRQLRVFRASYLQYFRELYSKRVGFFYDKFSYVFSFLKKVCTSQSKMIALWKQVCSSWTLSGGFPKYQWSSISSVNDVHHQTYLKWYLNHITQRLRVSRKKSSNTSTFINWLKWGILGGCGSDCSNFPTNKVYSTLITNHSVAAASVVYLRDRHEIGVFGALNLTCKTDMRTNKSLTFFPREKIQNWEFCVLMWQHRYSVDHTHGIQHKLLRR